MKNLKKQGKTVIAVSHGDRYYKYADRVVKMEYGTVVRDDTLKVKK